MILLLRVSDILRPTYSNLLQILCGGCGQSFISGDMSGQLWRKFYDVASEQGVLAVVWNGVLRQSAEEVDSLNKSLDRALKIRWALNVEQIERKYAKQKNAIVTLARFFARHGIHIMILKGYGLSLNYPIPEHRPCGDVDIWLFRVEKDDAGKAVITNVQSKADKLLREELNVHIDEDKHHHTVFYIDGVMFENHYDFLNIHSHTSNRLIEERLQFLVRKQMEKVSVDGEAVYLPSADFNALFLLRHSAAHFAAERIGLRHLLDWKYFVERSAATIDWASLDQFACEMNMHRFLHCINGICVDYLGLPATLLPPFERDCKLEQRVLAEIFTPEFSEPKPCNAGVLQSLSYMFRRWWANRWKHHIVYREGLVSTFFVQLISHLMKSKSLRFE